MFTDYYMLRYGLKFDVITFDHAWVVILFCVVFLEQNSLSIERACQTVN